MTDINSWEATSPEGEVLFDFPCSDTFRRYEDHLLGRNSLPRTETLGEARLREDREHLLQAREEMLERDTYLHTARHREIWEALNRIRIDQEDIRRRFEQEAWKAKKKKPARKSQKRDPIEVSL